MFLCSKLTDSYATLLQGEALSSIEVNVKRSSHHVELNISDLKGYEKHVIVKLINEKCNKSSDSVLESGLDNCQGNITLCSTMQAPQYQMML